MDSTPRSQHVQADRCGAGYRKRTRPALRLGCASAVIIDPADGCPRTVPIVPRADVT